MHEGRVKVYPRVLFEDWFFFFSVLWCLATKAFRGGKNCNRLPSFSSSFFSLPLLEGIFRYISHSHWSWPSICWSCRSLLECLSHSPPSSTCCELQQTRWYYSGVVSSLMRPDCQLRAFNAEVTASPRIAPPPCSYGWPIGLGTSFGMLEGTASGDMALSLSLILVCRGQGRPRQYILAVWVPFVRPRVFLPPRHGPWAWYEMGRSPQILWPHNSPSKSYCPAPRAGRRILMFSGLYHGRFSFVPLWAPGPLCLLKARSWCFGVRGTLSLIFLWDDVDRFGIRSVYSMAPLWSGADLAVEGSLGNWAKFISLDIPSLSFVRSEFP